MAATKVSFDILVMCFLLLEAKGGGWEGVDESGCALRRHHRFRSITDHVEQGPRLKEHRHVAALQLD
jgi:hypothetical protein